MTSASGLPGGARAKSQMGHGVVGHGDPSIGAVDVQNSDNFSTNGPSVLPSLPMSKMASQDVGALLSQMKVGA